MLRENEFCYIILSWLFLIKNVYFRVQVKKQQQNIANKIINEILFAAKENDAIRKHSNVKFYMQRACRQNNCKTKLSEEQHFPFGGGKIVVASHEKMVKKR